MVTSAKASKARSGVVSTPGIMGGSPVIAGTRVRVSDVVRYRHISKRAPIKGICEALPHLTREQVNIALQYYRRHSGEIDREIEAEQALSAECRTPRRST